ncbi:uncharacterized protein DS421_15g504940 [Arachis hypogaea]|nr:uncharacterized protein DS421_15g504940 [Arachis hypogaea]
MKKGEQRAWNRRGGRRRRHLRRVSPSVTATSPSPPSSRATAGLESPPLHLARLSPPFRGVRPGAARVAVLSFGAAVEESGVVTAVGERESQKRTRRVRKETHRGGTVPLPPLSPEFLVAVVVHDVCPALWFLFFRVPELLLHSRISFASIKFPSKIAVAATRVVGDAAAIPVVLE